MILVSFVFRKSAPNSDLAADEATNFKVVQRVYMVLFNAIGLPSIGSGPKNKCPPSQLRDLGAVVHQSVCLGLYLMRRNKLWILDMWPYSQGKFCTFLECFLLRGSVHLQYYSCCVV